MSDALKIKDNVSAHLIRNRGLSDCVDWKNVFHIEHYRAGKLITEFDALNQVKTEGKNHSLQATFANDTQVPTWYIGLMDNAGYTTEVPGDTLASHAGWAEFTGYTGDRKEWADDAAASGSKTNSTASIFALTSGGTLQGVFVCSVATGTTGILWSSVSFAQTIAVSNGDEIRVTYTVNF